MKTAVIIIGNDSDAYLSVASRALLDVYEQVEVTSFENAPKVVPDVARRLQDVESIVLLPFALELDEAQRSRLEDALDSARKVDTNIEIRLAPQVGFDRRMLEILTDRVQSALDESSHDQNVPILSVEHNGTTKSFTLPELDDLPGKIPDIGVHVADRSGEAVPVSAVLAAAEIKAGVTATFTSGDDFSADVDLETVRENGWMVIRLDGNPLPARFGGPVRLFIPGTDDRCANVKSVDRFIIE